MEQENIEYPVGDSTLAYNSNKTWDDLNLKGSLVRNLEKMNWIAPTNIQAIAIEMITSGKNIAAQSKNGTGKTGAFVIGCLNRIDKDFGAVQAICISHSRELNQQNHTVFTRIAEDTGVLIGISQKGDRQVPKCHILCGTHGTLVNLFKANRESLSDIKMIIYDECDFLLTHPGVVINISALRSAAPNSQQVLFSATFTDKVWEFIHQNIKNPTIIRIKKDEDLTLTNVEQYLIECSEAEKPEIIFNLIRSANVRTCLIFLNKKVELDQLHAFLTSRGYKAHVFAADRTDENVRDEIIEKVKRGEVKVLLTTNLLSRGVDLRHINIVVNADPPIGENRTVDFHSYLHRVGRTGRFGRKGLAVNIVSDADSLRCFKEIENHFGLPFSRGSIDEIAASLDIVNEDYQI